jgi:hypothetical protein
MVIPAWVLLISVYILSHSHSNQLMSGSASSMFWKQVRNTRCLS